MERLMSNNILPVSKFGFTKISYSLAFLLFFLIFDFDTLAFLAFVVSIALIYIYRNPEREVLIFEKNSLLSPVDGKIISIEELENSEYAYKIEIQNHITDIGVLRSPMSAKLIDVKLMRGAKTSDTSTLFKKINENATLIFEDEVGNKVTIEHRLKQSLDSIFLDVLKEQSVVQNSRYGFMSNGVTSLYLPQNFRLNVDVGFEVSGSQTLIGYFS
jgi:phosphatidylserine decarboxylase